METIKVNLKERSYDIIIGSHILETAGDIIRKLNIGNCAYIITTKIVKDNYGEILQKNLKSADFSLKFKIIPDTETSKSLKQAFSILQDLAYYNKNKRIFIIAFGGGVTGDLAGFIASIYRRGIPYIQIGTTLLAQVDSSIGGKTAIDLPRGKNLVGAFYQPKLVISDTAALKTLDLRQIKSGLAEVIKYSLIKDLELFDYLDKNYEPILKQENKTIEFIVKRCSLIKARIIEFDEKEEKGLRIILNFGHTIGHSIEAAGKFKKYTHGQAIALGMLIAKDISQGLGYLDNTASNRIEELIKKTGLPIKISGLIINDIIKAHYFDKKFAGRVNRFILLEKIGKAKIIENVPLKIIKEAVKKRI